MYFRTCGLGSQVGSGKAFLTWSRVGFPVGRQAGFVFYFVLPVGITCLWANTEMLTL